MAHQCAPLPLLDLMLIFVVSEICLGGGGIGTLIAEELEDLSMGCQVVLVAVGPAELLITVRAGVDPRAVQLALTEELIPLTYLQDLSN